jgi:hypothetical protein
VPEVAFIGVAPAAPLRGLTEALRYELSRQGIPSSAGTRFPEPRPDLVYALVDPRSYLSAGRRGPRLPDEPVLRRTVLLGHERPGATREGELLGLLRTVAAVFDVDPRTVAAMRTLGIDARPLEPGYSSFRDRSGEAGDRPIDVLALGGDSPRQISGLAGLAAALGARGRVMRQVAAVGERGEQLSTERRRSLLVQSKVLVIVHPGGSTNFDALLAVEAIHAGAVIVAEHAGGLGVLEPGRHLLVGAVGALPYVIDGLLRDPSRLVRLRRDASQRLRTWSPFAMSAAQFRAALVDAVGAPEVVGQDGSRT